MLLKWLIEEETGVCYYLESRFYNEWHLVDEWRIRVFPGQYLRCNVEICSFRVMYPIPIDEFSSVTAPFCGNQFTIQRHCLSTSHVTIKVEGWTTISAACLGGMLKPKSRVVGDQAVFDSVDVHVSDAGSGEFTSQLCAKCMQL